MTSHHTRLSPRDLSVIHTIQLFRQVTSTQILRLHFNDNSEASRRVRLSRTMRRLVKWGHVGRMERSIGGWSGGSADYIYKPATSVARIPDPHTLDITETYVSLRESGQLLTFDPEPYCHVQQGRLELKPDAYIRLQTPSGRYRYWLELDRGTEWRPALSAKMRRYVQAYHHWTEDTFPQVVFIAPDEMRARLIEGVAKRQEASDIFKVSTRFELE